MSDVTAVPMPDQPRAYALTDDDINEIADYIAGRDLREMRIPNGSVAGLIALLRDTQAEAEQLRTIQATLTARIVQRADLLHRAGREMVGSTTLRSEQQLREMAERGRDEARAELARVAAMAPAELLAWRADR